MNSAPKILVVDDDELTLAVLRKLLEAEDYQVEVCLSGHDALMRLAEKSYDAILCDMWMNGMSGKDFYLLLKQNCPHYQRKVIFITGDIASEATWEFIDERHLPYVIKPINRPLLRKKLLEIIGEPKGAAARMSTPAEARGRQPRAVINDAVQVRRKGSEVLGADTAVVVNASRGGIFFMSDREYRVGMDVVVAYPYTGVNDVEQDGYVVRVEEMPDGRRGVAVAIGEDAAAARAAASGSTPRRRSGRGRGDDPPGQRSWVSSEVATVYPVQHPAPKFSADDTAVSIRLAEVDEQARRLAEELEKLKRIHDQVIEERDRLAADEANLKKRLEDMEAAKAAMSRQVDGLWNQMQAYKRELKQTEKMRIQATHDALTGVWNRGAILEMLHRELQRADRDRSIVGVLLADLDHFKSINDTYGHLAGDAVLREAAGRILSAVRSYDAVGRYGGEEFLILLAGCSNDADMVKQAERLRAAVSAGEIHTSEGPINVTLSVGIASSADISDAEGLIRAADAALYRAKRSGRNRVELASSAPSEPASAPLGMAAPLTPESA